MPQQVRDLLSPHLCLSLYTPHPLTPSHPHTSPGSRMVRKQLAFMLGRQQIFVEVEEGEGGVEAGEVEDLNDIMSNVHLNNNFLALAREVGGGT